MKHILYVLSLTLLLAGCLNSAEHNNSEAEEGNGTNSAAAQPKNITSRDRSITKANSYSDLFFDSSLLHNFIAKNKLSDSIASRMVSFYNARNYQFAWFNSDGFTEEAQ